MEKELEQFRQEEQRLKAGRQRGSLPYPETLQAFAEWYVAHTLEAGGTFARAAKALGVSEPQRYKHGGGGGLRRTVERRPKHF
jgi:transposase